MDEAVEYPHLVRKLEEQNDKSIWNIVTYHCH